MLWTCVLLAQFLVKNYSEEQLKILENYTLIGFSLLIIVNVAYVVHMLCINCKIKKRAKWLEKQKK